jgi:hypothetical protein
MDDDDDKHDDGHVSNSFITPILIFILCIILVYLILHNKNKVNLIFFLDSFIFLFSIY